MTDANQDPLAVDATRRTRLANERTELAWWRTGMTVFALALAVSRVIPDLADTTTAGPTSWRASSSPSTASL